MKMQGRIAMSLAVIATVAAAAVAPRVVAHDSPKPTASKKAAMAKASSDYMAVMQKHNREMQAMKMSGDADKDFAMMMTHHHQGAIEMAEIELRDGKDPKIRDMAQKIIDSQKKEIAEFQDWLQKNGGHSSH